MATRRANIHRPKEWFAVLQTTNRSQTAVMTLASGQATGEKAEAHEASEIDVMFNSARSIKLNNRSSGPS